MSMYKRSEIQSFTCSWPCRSLAWIAVLLLFASLPTGAVAAVNRNPKHIDPVDSVTQPGALFLAGGSLCVAGLLGRRLRK